MFSPSSSVVSLCLAISLCLVFVLSLIWPFLKVSNDKTQLSTPTKILMDKIQWAAQKLHHLTQLHPVCCTQFKPIPIRPYKPI